MLKSNLKITIYDHNSKPLNSLRLKLYCSKVEPIHCLEVFVFSYSMIIYTNIKKTYFHRIIFTFSSINLQHYDKSIGLQTK